MQKLRPAGTTQVSAPLRCVIRASAPKRRIRVEPSHQILEADMIVVCGDLAYIGRVRPEDSQHVTFQRKEKRYRLKEGEFELFRIVE